MRILDRTICVVYDAKDVEECFELTEFIKS